MSNKYICAFILALSSLLVNAQESNIRKFTPSKLLEKGQWDFKIFNNLYTETKGIDDSSRVTNYPRDYYFTTTFEMVYGISKNQRLNVGIIANFKSNVNNSSEEENYGLSDVFSFKDQMGVSRSGLTSFAPTIKFTPSGAIGNLSIQSSFFIPLIDRESENGVFLDKKSYIWENRLFFDKNIKSNYQIFLELDVNYQFGDKANYETGEGGFANNSLAVPVSAFFSYFLNEEFTIYAMTQHYQLIDLGNEFSQNFTQSGLGTKYQLTDRLNLELLYTNFWRGNSTGLGETFNFGLRYLIR